MSTETGWSAATEGTRCDTRGIEGVLQWKYEPNDAEWDAGGCRNGVTVPFNLGREGSAKRVARRREGGTLRVAIQFRQRRSR